MGGAKVETKIRPVPVASLDLPEGVRAEIAKIAEGEGSKSDLDTAEEFKAAAEALRQIHTKSSAVALSKLKLNPAIQISLDRITVWEGDTQYEYCVQFLGPSLFKGSIGFLLRRNVETGDTETIYQDAIRSLRGGGSSKGAIKQIAAVGNEIFVLFSGETHTFGKVVVNESGKKVIQYTDLSESDWKICEFVEENGRLAIKTTNDNIPGGGPALVSYFVFSAKEFYYSRRVFKP